jgi:hypothetical protein
LERQVCIADWNAGELTDTPLTVIDPPEPARCWISSPPWPLEPGSGKFGTPCERTHCANASMSARLPPAALWFDEDDDPHAPSAKPPAATASTAPNVAIEFIPEVYETLGNTRGTSTVTAT